jgi:hypothetical protein
MNGRSKSKAKNAKLIRSILLLTMELSATSEHSLLRIWVTEHALFTLE